MSAAELGDNLAQLIWESFTDFVERRSLPREDHGGGAGVLVMPTVDPEEALIFFMWIHTRACQQACGEFETRGAEILDAMHKAIYEDLEAQDIPRVQLPLFEQRTATRYSDYYEAARNKDEKVVEVAARHMLVNEMKRPGILLDLAEAATVTSGPLRDFLHDIIHETHH